MNEYAKDGLRTLLIVEKTMTAAEYARWNAEYVEAMKILIEKLEIHKIVDKNVTYEFYNSNNVKKRRPSPSLDHCHWKQNALELMMDTSHRQVSVDICNQIWI